jgi:hypothetical protein
MIYETGHRVLNQLEKQFGKLALPKLLRWVAGFQVLSWVLSGLSPDFVNWIVFDREAVLSGEVWRVFTWVMVPMSKNVLFVVITALFIFFINDSLESEWDSFRLNVYVFASIIFISIAGLIPLPTGSGLLLNGIFYSAIFLAFASLFPNQVIHLFAIIPIKAKWLGWANAAFLLAAILTSPSPPVFAAVTALGLTPYLLTFVPGFVTAYRQQTQATVRRHRFETAIPGEGASFHECESCGATEKSHPERDFRVSAEGKEYCGECRRDAAG